MAAGAPPLDQPPVVEALAFGRQQVLHTRDQLGRAEGLFEAPGPAQHVGLLLEDAKGYEFPADVDPGGARLFNALSLIHISEPTRLGMISYAVFCLKKKKQQDKA